MDSQPKNPVDLIVTNGTLLSNPSQSLNIPQGALAVANGRIIALGPKTQVKGLYEAKKIIDARGGLIIAWAGEWAQPRGHDLLPGNGR